MVRRSVRTASVVLACAAAMSAAGTTTAMAQTPARGTACTTSQTIRITGLSFQPPAVYPGQSSEATATVLNCTGQQQQAGAQWMGRWIGSSPGIPAGCPVIDPVILQVNLAPHAQGSSSIGYLVPSSCTASALVVTVEIIQNGAIIAERSATLVIK
ncbi:MAG TPA: hypothetical protein VGZ32_17225 [Actinocrinis sp.]|jgi:hypothetical protein|uniref:hypothetical protein n=1 Tax=Actinocrinis sp. TaxID=1920516 RepID=UPI002DDCAA5C|nr:hypothetical protein [Actinocrinis sp.]HEV3172096.1 hypothetical protein [Actinocrinis sp.]